MKKFIVGILALVLIGLFAYHFIAANQAEKNMDEAIQMQADSLGNTLSVQYSSIDISPFSGNINFSDGTIVRQSNIERFNNAEIDLDYIDFLKIAVNGLEEGLRTIEDATMRIQKASHLNRKTLQEISSAEMNVSYSGNLWDGLQYLAASAPLDYNHNINITGKTIRYNKPQSTFGTFKSDSAAFRYAFKPASPEQQSSSTSMSFNKIEWTPPTEFQNKYAFFIKGFGYELNAIPVSQFNMTLNHTGNRAISISDSEVQTELATINFSGSVQSDSTWNDAQLSPLDITVVNLSPELKNILSSIENLLGFEISQTESGIHFQLVGPLANPRIINQE